MFQQWFSKCVEMKCSGSLNSNIYCFLLAKQEYFFIFFNLQKKTLQSQLVHRLFWKAIKSIPFGKSLKTGVCVNMNGGTMKLFEVGFIPKSLCCILIKMSIISLNLNKVDLLGPLCWGPLVGPGPLIENHYYFEQFLVMHIITICSCVCIHVCM